MNITPENVLVAIQGMDEFEGMPKFDMVDLSLRLSLRLNWNEAEMYVLLHANDDDEIDKTQCEAIQFQIRYAQKHIDAFVSMT